MCSLTRPRSLPTTLLALEEAQSDSVLQPALPQLQAAPPQA